MGKDKEFEKWFDEYFCNQQGEDSPYSYNDIKIAFYKGWKEASKLAKGRKEERERILEIIDDIQSRLIMGTGVWCLCNTLKQKIKENKKNA